MSGQAKARKRSPFREDSRALVIDLIRGVVESRSAPHRARHPAECGNENVSPRVRSTWGGGREGGKGTGLRCGAASLLEPRFPPSGRKPSSVIHSTTLTARVKSRALSNQDRTGVFRTLAKRPRGRAWCAWSSSMRRRQSDPGATTSTRCTSSPPRRATETEP